MTAGGNLGGLDRGVRAAIGLASLFLAFTMFHLLDGGLLGIAAAIFALVMLITAARAVCPIYLPLKISTRRE